MAVTYTITIDAVRVTTQDALADVVKELDFTLRGEDSGCVFVLPNTKKVGAADPEAFTPFADLTEAQLISWVEADATILDPMKAHIAFVLEREVGKAQLEQKPLPWAPEPAPTPDPATP